MQPLPETKTPRPRTNRPGSNLVWPLVALALLLLYNLFFTPGFFHIKLTSAPDPRLFGSLIDILNRAAPVMLLALGMTLVIATGGVDLSVGAVMAISGAMAAFLIVEKNAPLPMLIIIPLLVSVAAGVFNGILVAYAEIQPIVATLVLMVAGRGIAQLITNGQILTFNNKGFEFIGGGYFLLMPFTVTIVLLMLLVTSLLTRRTALGLFIESVGDNPTASRYAGIKVAMVKVAVYAFCALCAGLAGLIPVSDIKAADSNNAGLYLEMDAILSVVIGGTSLNGGRFFLIGSLVGALIIQTLTTTILARGVEPELTLVVKAIVVLVVCLLQSEAFRTMTSRRLRRKAA